MRFPHFSLPLPSTSTVNCLLPPLPFPNTLPSPPSLTTTGAPTSARTCLSHSLLPPPTPLPTTTSPLPLARTSVLSPLQISCASPLSPPTDLPLTGGGFVITLVVASISLASLREEIARPRFEWQPGNHVFVPAGANHRGLQSLAPRSPSSPAAEHQVLS